MSTLNKESIIQHSDTPETITNKIYGMLYRMVDTIKASEIEIAKGIVKYGTCNLSVAFDPQDPSTSAQAHHILINIALPALISQSQVMGFCVLDLDEWQPGIIYIDGTHNIPVISMCIKVTTIESANTYYAKETIHDTAQRLIDSINQPTH